MNTNHIPFINYNWTNNPFTFEIFFEFYQSLPIYLVVAVLIAKAILGPIPSMHIMETNLNDCIRVVTRLHHTCEVYGTFVVPRTLMMGIRNVSRVTSMQIRMRPVVRMFRRSNDSTRSIGIERLFIFWKITEHPCWNIHKRLIPQCVSPICDSYAEF